MNNFRFQRTSPGHGDLFVNGVQLEGVVSVELDLFNRSAVPTVTVVFSADKFEMVPAPAPGTEASDYMRVDEVEPLFP